MSWLFHSESDLQVAYFCFGESLAATLQSLDGDGYRSRVDAVVWSTLSAVIAELLKTGSDWRLFASPAGSSSELAPGQSCRS